MYCDCEIDQERIEANEAAQCEWRSLGATDAAFGTLPQYANDAYLAGYCTKLKELPKDESGKLIHHKPTRHFAFGYVDTLEHSRAADEF